MLDAENISTFLCPCHVILMYSIQGIFLGGEHRNVNPAVKPGIFYKAWMITWRPG